MPKIPAICRNCGAIFSSGINMAGGNVNLTITNCGSVCPHCKGPADIPDGTYSALSDTILAFTKGTVTKEHLETLVKILKGAKESQLGPQEVADEIQREVPQVSSISRFFPKTRPELYSFLTMLAAFVMAFSSIMGLAKPTPTITEDRVKQLVEKTISEVTKSSDQGAPTSISDRSTREAEPPSRNRSETRKKKRHNRNAPCPCGSGRKYKKCCGAR